MSVKIRLRRMGCNKTPFYRVVVSDSRSPVKGRFLETVGWYDPKLKGLNFKLEMDRIEHWKSNGATLSDTVRSLVKMARTGRLPAEPTPKTPPAADTPEVAPAPVEAAEEAVTADEPAPAPVETPEDAVAAQEAPAANETSQAKPKEEEPPSEAAAEETDKTADA